MIRYYNKELTYAKKRRSFGREPLFQVVPAHIVDSIPSNRKEQKEYILRNPVNREVQATLPQSIHDSNTIELVFRDHGINHTEGGWPKEIHVDHEEQQERHRRRVKHEENYIHTITSLTPTMTHYVDQNNAIDMYQSYYAGMPEQPPVETYSMRVTSIFRDTLRRTVSCVRWTHEPNAKLVVSYCIKERDYVPSDSNRTKCFLWDINNQNKPIGEIAPSHPCWKLACSPVDPDIIVTGLGNGTVSLFDTRHGSASVSQSSPYNSHRDPITSIVYTHTRTNTEFFSGSLDGQCLWWDMRNLSKPTDQLPMSVRMGHNVTPDLSNAEGVSCLEYDNGVPTKFLCGTESGLVINANRMGRSHSEILTSYWDAHSGPVRAVRRSPCTLRMFLTCGDWTVRVWSEEVRTAPIIVFKPYRRKVNDAAWAPLRYSSLMSVSDDGALYYWDLLRKCHEPVSTVHVTKYPLLCLTPHENGESIAVANNNGSVFIVQLSENMVIPDDNDRHRMQDTYNRETRREHILDNRLKEIRLKQKFEEEAEAAEPVPEADDEEIDRTTEEEYWNIVNNERRQLDGSIAASMFNK